MPEGGNNYIELKEFCANSGIDLFGTADISKIREEFFLPKKVIESLDWAVSLGVRLSSSVLDTIENAPNKLYYHHYRTVNLFLDEAALRISSYIQKKNFNALCLPASQIIDWQNQKAHVSHKKIGYLAGLGWFGRNNLLVNEEFGSQFRLTTVLTDMPLRAGQIKKQNCAECRLCAQACPCRAIKDTFEDFNHLRCFEQLKEFQKKRLVDQYICGVCVKVCRGTRTKSTD